MYGSTRQATQPAPPPRPSNGAQTPQPRIGQTRAGETDLALPLIFAGAILLYLVYAVVEQHEKLKSAIRPANVGVNVRNIVVMLATVILGIPLAKVGAVKLNALTGGRFGTRSLVQWVGLA